MRAVGGLASACAPDEYMALPSWWDSERGEGIPATTCTIFPIILIKTSALQRSDSQSVRSQIGNTSVTWKCGENANQLFPSIFTFTCIILFSEAYGTNLLCDSFLSILRQKLDLIFTVLWH